MAIDLGRWKPDLHPRDSKGRFRDKWGLGPKAAAAVDRLLAGFNPPTLRSDEHAAGYLRGQKGPRSLKQKEALRLFLTREGNENIQSTLRAGDEDTPAIRELRAMARPLQHDLVMSRVVGPDAFGLRGDQIDGVEEWSGKLVSDHGFQPMNVGNPYQVAGPHVEIRALIPKGTMAIVVGDDGGPDEARTVILMPDQPLQLGSIKSDNRGGWYAMATGAPKQGTGPSRGLGGRPLSAREKSAAIEATPDELERRGIAPDAGVGPQEQPGRFGEPTPSPGAGQQVLPQQGQPAGGVQSIPNPAAGGATPVAPVKKAGGKAGPGPAEQIQAEGGIPVGAGKVLGEGETPAPRKKITQRESHQPVSEEAGRAAVAAREQATREKELKDREDRRVAAEKVLAEREAHLREREAAVQEKDAAATESLAKANDSLSKTVDNQARMIDQLMGREGGPLPSSEGGTKAAGMTERQKDSVTQAAKRIGDQPGPENDRLRDVARQVREERAANGGQAPPRKAGAPAAPTEAPTPTPTKAPARGIKSARKAPKDMIADLDSGTLSPDEAKQALQPYLKKDLVEILKGLGATNGPRRGSKATKSDIIGDIADFMRPAKQEAPNLEGVDTSLESRRARKAVEGRGGPSSGEGRVINFPRPGKKAAAPAAAEPAASPSAEKRALDEFRDREFPELDPIETQDVLRLTPDQDETYWTRRQEGASHVASMRGLSPEPGAAKKAAAARKAPGARRNNYVGKQIRGSQLEELRAGDVVEVPTTRGGKGVERKTVRAIDDDGTVIFTDGQRFNRDRGAVKVISQGQLPQGARAAARARRDAARAASGLTADESMAAFRRGDISAEQATKNISNKLTDFRKQRMELGDVDTPASRRIDKEFDRLEGFIKEMNLESGTPTPAPAKERAAKAAVKRAARAAEGAPPAKKAAAIKKAAPAGPALVDAKRPDAANVNAARQAKQVADINALAQEHGVRIPSTVGRREDRRAFLEKALAMQDGESPAAYRKRMAELKSPTVPVKRGRGRPRKEDVAARAAAESAADTAGAPAKKAAPIKKAAAPRETVASRARTTKVGSALHENWRKDFEQQWLKERAEGKPGREGPPERPKKTKDQDWIAKHGTETVDIYNTAYDDLPDDWQAENRDAGRIVQNILQREGGSVDLNDEATRLRLGEEIHQAWLDRHGDEKWEGDDGPTVREGALGKPFAELPASEQKKDIDQLEIGMKALERPTKVTRAAKKAPAIKAAPAKKVAKKATSEEAPAISADRESVGGIEIPKYDQAWTMSAADRRRTISNLSPEQVTKAKSQIDASRAILDEDKYVAYLKRRTPDELHAMMSVAGVRPKDMLQKSSSEKKDFIGQLLATRRHRAATAAPKMRPIGQTGGPQSLEGRVKSTGMISLGKILPGDQVLVEKTAEGKWRASTRVTRAIPITVDRIEVESSKGGWSRTTNFKSIVGHDAEGNEIRTVGSTGTQAYKTYTGPSARQAAKEAKAAKAAAPAAKKAAPTKAAKEAAAPAKAVRERPVKVTRAAEKKATKAAPEKATPAKAAPRKTAAARAAENASATRAERVAEAQQEIQRLIKATRASGDRVDRGEVESTRATKIANIERKMLDDNAYKPDLRPARSGTKGFDAIPSGLYTTPEGDAVWHGFSDDAKGRAEMRAALGYRTLSSRGINSGLRSGEKLSPQGQATVRGLRSAMDRSRTTHEITAYRGGSPRSIGAPSLPDDAVGHTWTDDSFASTTLHKPTAEGFGRDKTLLTIKVPAGTPALQMSGKEYESEVLLGQGLTYRVTADHGVKDGVRHLDVEVVPVAAKKAAPARAIKKAAAPERPERPVKVTRATPVSKMSESEILAEAAKGEGTPARQTAIKRAADRINAREARTAKKAVPAKKAASRRRVSPIDPVSIYKDGGEDGLRERLSTLDVEQLRDVVAGNGMDSGRRSAKWDHGQLADLIVARSHDRATKGQEFRPPAKKAAPTETATSGAQVLKAPSQKVGTLKVGDRVYAFTGRYGAQAKPPAGNKHGLREEPQTATITRIDPDGKIFLETDKGFKGQLFGPGGADLRPRIDSAHRAPAKATAAPTKKAAPERPTITRKAAVKAATRTFRPMAAPAGPRGGKYIDTGKPVPEEKRDGLRATPSRHGVGYYVDDKDGNHIEVAFKTEAGAKRRVQDLKDGANVHEYESPPRTAREIAADKKEAARQNALARAVGHPVGPTEPEAAPVAKKAAVSATKKAAPIKKPAPFEVGNPTGNDRERFEAIDDEEVRAKIREVAENSYGPDMTREDAWGEALDSYDRGEIHVGRAPAKAARKGPVKASKAFREPATKESPRKVTFPVPRGTTMGGPFGTEKRRFDELPDDATRARVRAAARDVYGPESAGPSLAWVRALDDYDSGKLREAPKAPKMRPLRGGPPTRDITPERDTSIRRTAIKRGGKQITAADARRESAVDALRGSEISGEESAKYHEVLRNVQSGEWPPGRGASELIAEGTKLRRDARDVRRSKDLTPAQRKKMGDQLDAKAEKYEAALLKLNASQTRESIDKRRFTESPAPAKRVRKAASRPLPTQESADAEDRAARETMQPFLDKAGVDFDELSDLDKTGVMLMGLGLNDGKISRPEAARRLSGGDRKDSPLRKIGDAIAGTPRTKKVASSRPVPTAAERKAAGYPDVPAGVNIDEDQWHGMSYSERLEAITAARSARPERPVKVTRAAEKKAAKAAARKAPAKKAAVDPNALTADQIAERDSLTPEQRQKYDASIARGIAHDTAIRAFPRGSSIEDLRRPSQPAKPDEVRAPGTGGIEELRRPSIERTQITRAEGSKRLTEDEKNKILRQVDEAKAENPNWPFTREERDLNREAEGIRVARDDVRKAAAAKPRSKVTGQEIKPKKVTPAAAKARAERARRYDEAVPDLPGPDGQILRKVKDDLAAGDTATSVKKRLLDRAEFYRSSAEIGVRIKSDEVEPGYVARMTRNAERYEKAAELAGKRIPASKKQIKRGAKVPVKDLTDGDVAILNGRKGLFRQPSPRKTFIEFPDGTKEPVRKTSLAQMVRDKNLELLGGEHRPETLEGEAPAKVAKVAKVAKAAKAVRPERPVKVTKAAPRKVGARKAAKATEAVEPEVVAPVKKTVIKRAAKKEAPAEKFLSPLADGTRRKTATNLKPGDRVRFNRKGSEPMEVASVEPNGGRRRVTFTDGTSSSDNANTVYWMVDEPAAKKAAPKLRPFGQAGTPPVAAPERDTPTSIVNDLDAGRISRAEARKRIAALSRPERKADLKAERDRIRSTAPRAEAPPPTRAEERRLAREADAARKADLQAKRDQVRNAEPQAEAPLPDAREERRLAREARAAEKADLKARRDRVRNAEPQADVAIPTRAEGRRLDREARAARKADLQAKRDEVRNAPPRAEAPQATSAAEERRLNRETRAAQKAARAEENRANQESGPKDWRTDLREHGITLDSQIKQAFEENDGPNGYKAMRRLDEAIINDRLTANMLDYGTKTAPEGSAGVGLSPRSRKLRRRADNRAKALHLLNDRADQRIADEARQARKAGAPRMRPMGDLVDLSAARKAKAAKKAVKATPEAPTKKAPAKAIKKAVEAAPGPSPRKALLELRASERNAKYGPDGPSHIDLDAVRGDVDLPEDKAILDEVQAMLNGGATPRAAAERLDQHANGVMTHGVYLHGKHHAEESTGIPFIDDARKARGPKEAKELAKYRERSDKLKAVAEKLRGTRRPVARKAAVKAAAPEVAKKVAVKATPTVTRKPVKGSIVEWRTDDGKVTKGEIVTVPRKGVATVQWHDGLRETGVDVGAEGLRVRNRRANEAITPRKTAPARAIKKAAVEAATPEAAGRDADLEGMRKPELLQVARREGVPSPGRFDAEELKRQISSVRDMGPADPDSTVGVDNRLRELGLPTSVAQLRKVAGDRFPEGKKLRALEFKREFVKRMEAGNFKDELAKESAPDVNPRQAEIDRVRGRIKEIGRDSRGGNAHRRTMQDRLQGLEYADHAEDLAPEDLTPAQRKEWADNYRSRIDNGSGHESAARESNIDLAKKEIAATKAAKAAKAAPAKKATPTKAEPAKSVAELRDDYDAAVRRRSEAFDRDGQAGWSREDANVQQAGDRLAEAAKQAEAAKTRVRKAVPKAASPADRHADNVARLIESSAQSGNQHLIPEWIDGLDDLQQRRLAARLGFDVKDTPNDKLRGDLLESLGFKRDSKTDPLQSAVKAFNDKQINEVELARRVRAIDTPAAKDMSQALDKSLTDKGIDISSPSAARPTVRRKAQPPRSDVLQKDLIAAGTPEKRRQLLDQHDDLTVTQWRGLATKLGISGHSRDDKNGIKDRIEEHFKSGDLTRPKKSLRDELRDADVSMAPRFGQWDHHGSTIEKAARDTPDEPEALRKRADEFERNAHVSRGLADMVEANRNDQPDRVRAQRDGADEYDKAAKVFRRRAARIEKGQIAANKDRTPEAPAERSAPDVVPTKERNDKETLARYRDMTREQYDALSPADKKEADDALGAIRDSGHQVPYTIPSNRTSMRTTIRGLKDAPEVEESKQLLSRFKRIIPAPIDRSPAATVRNIEAIKAGDLTPDQKVVGVRVALGGKSKNELRAIAEEGKLPFGEHLTNDKNRDRMARDAIGVGPAPRKTAARKAPSGTPESRAAAKERDAANIDRIREQVKASQARNARAAAVDESVPLGNMYEDDNMRMHGDSPTMTIARAYASDGRNGSANRMVELRRRATTSGPDGISPQQVVDELRAIRAAETDPKFQRQLDSAIEKIDAPQHPMPDLPENLPPLARKLIDDLQAIPYARKRDGERVSIGSVHGPSLVEQVAQVYRNAAIGKRDERGQAPGPHIGQILRNKTHESNEASFRLWKMGEELQFQSPGQGLSKELRDMERAAVPEDSGLPKPAKEITEAAREVGRGDVDAQVEAARARLDGRKKTARIEKAEGSMEAASDLFNLTHAYRRGDDPEGFQKVARERITARAPGDLSNKRDMKAAGWDALQKAMGDEKNWDTPEKLDDRLRKVLADMGITTEHSSGDRVKYNPETMGVFEGSRLKPGDDAQVIRPGLTYRDEDGTSHTLVKPMVSRPRDEDGPGGGGGNGPIGGPPSGPQGFSDIKLPSAKEMAAKPDSGLQLLRDLKDVEFTKAQGNDRAMFRADSLTRKMRTFELQSMASRLGLPDTKGGTQTDLRHRIMTELRRRSGVSEPGNQQLREELEKLTVEKLIDRLPDGMKKPSAATKGDLIEMIVGDGPKGDYHVDSSPAIKELERRIDAGTTDKKYYGGGSMGQVALVEDAEGNDAVRKRLTTDWFLDGERQADAEQLFGDLAGRTQTQSPTVYRPYARTVYMDKIDGKLAETFSDEEIAKAVASPQGRRIALIDAITGNDDRHNNNWMIRPDETPEAFDNSLAFARDGSPARRDARGRILPGPVHELDPFAPHYKYRTFVPKKNADGATMGMEGVWLDSHDFPKQELLNTRKELVAMKPQFEQLHREDWYKDTLDRLDALILRAKPEDELRARPPAPEATPAPRKITRAAKKAAPAAPSRPEAPRKATKAAPRPAKKAQPLRPIGVAGDRRARSTAEPPKVLTGQQDGPDLNSVGNTADTGPDGVPIRNFQIRPADPDADPATGYTIRSGTYYRHDGVPYLIEHADTPQAKAEAQKIQKVLAAHRESLPPSVRKHAAGYSWLRGENPADEDFAREFNLSPGQKFYTEAASDSFGGVYLFNRNQYGARGLGGALDHEFAHTLDHSALGTSLHSSSVRWRDSAAADAKTRQSLFDVEILRGNRSGGTNSVRLETATPENVNPGMWQAVKFPDGVSDYGLTSPHENSPEAFRLYHMGGPIGTARLTPGGPKEPIWFRDLFPEQASIMDDFMPDFAQEQLAEIAKVRGLPAARRTRAGAKLVDAHDTSPRSQALLDLMRPPTMRPIGQTGTPRPRVERTPAERAEIERLIRGESLDGVPNVQTKDGVVTGRVNVLDNVNEILPKDTGPEGMPVQSLELQNLGGYTIDQGRIWKLNGVTYLLEDGGTPDEQRQVMDTLFGEHSTLPGNARAFQRGYVALRKPDPFDAYMEAKERIEARRTGVAPPKQKLRTIAGAIGGDTIVYGLGTLPLEGQLASVQKSIRHESGHNFDSGLGQFLGLPSKKLSTDPQWLDAVEPPRRIHGFKPGERAPLSAIQWEANPDAKFPNGVTRYGTSSPEEDFAEAISMYFGGQIGLGALTDGGPEVPVWFRDIWPARAAVLDRYFKQFAEEQAAEIARRRA